MKTILITGIDGSGKSTLFNKLEKDIQSEKFALIKLPFMNTGSFRHEEDLFKVASFVNAMNSESDRSVLPHLKGLALFCSMLLYRKIVEAQDKACTLVICERHPIIDTGVYGRFYGSTLNKSNTQPTLFQEMDRSFPFELEYVLSLIPDKFIPDAPGLSGKLVAFMQQWFSKESNLTPQALTQLFNTELPDHIFYLKAPPEVLYNRIKDRAVHEAHETEETIRKFSVAYNRLFEITLHQSGSRIENVDAADFENLEKFYFRLQKIVHNHIHREKGSK